MPEGICPSRQQPIENVNFFQVVGCDTARARNPSDNPDGKCDHWIYGPNHPGGMDNPNMTGDLLDGEGVGGAVNCYPGVPGMCHQNCYIFVDWVTDPWECLRRQINSCEDTQHIYLIGSWESLKRHQMRGRKIKHWLNAVGMFRPNLVNVQAREGSMYLGGRLENLGPL